MLEFDERFFRSGSLRIHFRDWSPSLPAGRAEQARDVVIVHGLRDHSHSFDDLARGLAHEFRVLALDLRGHGDSETTPFYAFGHFVFDLHNMIRALRLESPMLIGHSMGGEIVGHYAGCFPDVPGAITLIEGLGPPPGGLEGQVDWVVSSFGRIDRAIAGPPGLPDLDKARERLQSRNPRLTPERAAELARLGTRAREDGMLEWKFDPMLSTMGLGGGFHLEYSMALWKRVRAPALIVNGGDSGEFWQQGPATSYLAPDDLQARLGCFSDHTYEEIPGAGHMVHFDRPAALLKSVLAFLRRHA